MESKQYLPLTKSRCSITGMVPLIPNQVSSTLAATPKANQLTICTFTKKNIAYKF